MDRGAIEHPESFSMDREAIKNTIKSSWRVSIDSLSVESYRDCLKTIFQRREKHRYECIQACYLIKNSKNILSSQKHLSIKKNVKHLNPKHTHTLNKSNQFYISKTS